MDDIERSFAALKTALKGLNVSIKESEGNNPFFTAYTESDKFGNPANGVFVQCPKGRHLFRWGTINQEPITKVEAAARRIHEYLQVASHVNRITTAGDGIAGRF